MIAGSKTKLRLNFGNLPLVDAAVRVSFAAPVELTFRTVNLLAERLRSDFPQLAELDRFRIPPGVEGSVTLGAGQIPGAVYSGNIAGLGITLQNQLIIARWSKKITGARTPEYPRFEALASALWRAVESFREVCDQPFPGIAVMNMSYVNFISIAHDESILRYFSEEAQIHAARSAKRIHKIESAWQETDGTDLRINLEQVKATVQEETVEGFRLTTAAGRYLTDAIPERAALEGIHERLLSLFLGILSRHAREEWQLETIQ